MQRRLSAAATITVAIGGCLGGCTGGDRVTSSEGGGGASSSSSAAIDAAAGTGAGLPEGTPHVRWLQHWGSRDEEKVNAVVIDPDDAVVVAGTIGIFDAGLTPLSSVDAEDIVLARFDVDGELVASRALSGPSQNGPRALARQRDGTYAMLGVFGDTFPAFEPALEAFGGPAVFVGSFDADFETLWGRAFVGAATGRGQTTMTTTEPGALVVAGTFDDALVSEAGVTTATGPSDAYVARLSSQGDVEWLITFGGPDVEHLEIGASTALGEEAVIAGQLRGTLRSAGGAELIRSENAARAFVARFDVRGVLTAVRLVAGDGSSAITKLASRPDGLLASVVHGGALVTPAGDLVAAGEGDATLLWLDDAGAPLFGKTWGDLRAQQIVGIDVDPAGNVLASGSFFGGLDFGDGFHRTSDGRPDGFAVSLSPTGVTRRTIIAGDVPPAEGKSQSSQGTSNVAWLSGGDAIVAGNFGGTMLLGDREAKSAGGLDAFVARVELAP